MMQNIVPIDHPSNLQLTDGDKLRIGIAWDALSPNSRCAYHLTWIQLDEFPIHDLST